MTCIGTETLLYNIYFMATQRKKSINDIEAQETRIVRAMRAQGYDPAGIYTARSYRGNNDDVSQMMGVNHRAVKVFRTAQRYMENIGKSKQGLKAYYDAYNRAGMDKASKGYRAMESVKVPRSAYMGLANG